MPPSFIPSLDRPAVPVLLQRLGNSPANSRRHISHISVPYALGHASGPVVDIYTHLYISPHNPMVRGLY